ncbi:ABC transporter ATP-binding protein [bacterium]|nr:ABC transporter ATP-binding protein [bacterium]MBU1024781.1 ABC transporter ATP-binding protein [bacterium]
MIELRNLNKTYGVEDTKVFALRDVDLDIKEGELIAIMGPSGSGKSTLMNIIGCLDSPTSGSYKLNDREIAGLDDNNLAYIRNQTIGFVFQSFNLLARTSALENVELPLIYSGKSEIREMAIDALNIVGLGDRIKHKPNQLSGGEQQRVAIARAIVHKPEIILADEPTGNLDTKAGNEIMRIFSDLNTKGQTVIIVTHNVDIGNMTKRILKFRDGFLVDDQQNSSRVLPWENVNSVTQTQGV